MRTAHLLTGGGGANLWVGVSSWGCHVEGCHPGGGGAVRNRKWHHGNHSFWWAEWLTDRCKNITFPQLRVRAVKMLCAVQYQNNYIRDYFE